MKIKSFGRKPRITRRFACAISPCGPIISPLCQPCWPSTTLCPWLPSRKRVRRCGFRKRTTRNGIENAVIMVSLVPDRVPTGKLHLVPHIHFPGQVLSSQEGIHLLEIPLFELPKLIRGSHKETTTKPPVHRMKRSNALVPTPWDVDSRRKLGPCDFPNLFMGLLAVPQNMKNTKVNPRLLRSCIFFHGPTYQFNLGVDQYMKPKGVLLGSGRLWNLDIREISMGNRQILLGQPF